MVLSRCMSCTNGMLSSNYSMQRFFKFLNIIWSTKTIQHVVLGGKNCLGVSDYSQI
jgi:hypothetical protein